MRIVSVVFAASVAWAASGVEAPSAGFARSSDGTMVRVSGIAGAFVAAATEHGAVVSSAFSGQLGLLKMAGSIRVLNAAGESMGEWDAPSGPAVLGFDSTGLAGAAYYPDAGTLGVYVSGEWRAAPFQADREVLAVALKDSEHLRAVVGGERLSLVSIRASDGAVEDETVLELGRGPALLPPGGGVLFYRDEGLIYRDDRGAEHAVPFAGEAAALLQMGRGWVQIQLRSGPDLAVRLTPEVRVFEIPEAQQ